MKKLLGALISLMALALIPSCANPLSPNSTAGDVSSRSIAYKAFVEMTDQEIAAGNISVGGEEPLTLPDGSLSKSYSKVTFKDAEVEAALEVSYAKRYRELLGDAAYEKLLAPPQDRLITAVDARGLIDKVKNTGFLGTGLFAGKVGYVNVAVNQYTTFLFFHFFRVIISTEDSRNYWQNLAVKAWTSSGDSPDTGGRLIWSNTNGKYVVSSNGFHSWQLDTEILGGWEEAQNKVESIILHFSDSENNLQEFESGSNPAAHSW